MGMDLYNHKNSFRFNNSGWRSVLELAFKRGGWQPAGTLHNEADDWSGGYFSNDGQMVTDEDANNLASALELSLDDVPDFDALEAKTKILVLPNGDKIQCIPDTIPISPLEAWSGDGKIYLKEFITFCREGAFSIH